MTAQEQEVISIKSGNLALELYPAVGGSVASFQLQRGGGTIDLFRPFDKSLPLDALNMASFPLTPYSNRIINCHLDFEGEILNVGPPFGTELHQLHGDGWKRAWQVSERGDNYAVLHLPAVENPHTPYFYEAEQVFELTPSRLTISMRLTNRGRRLPFGLGHHPYFPRNDRTVLKAYLPEFWHSNAIVPQRLSVVPSEWDFSRGIEMADHNFAPARQGVKGLDLMDHCFHGWDQQAEITWPDKKLRVTMSADENFKDFVIYIPQHFPFFCAEAVTHVIDAFNLQGRGVQDTGTVILNEGESLSGKTWFDVEEI